MAISEQAIFSARSLGCGPPRLNIPSLSFFSAAAASWSMLIGFNFGVVMGIALVVYFVGSLVSLVSLHQEQPTVNACGNYPNTT